jgi:DnaD/phage-associated family protein
VPGWVKLWRQLLDNGHFKMPDQAFKLWIYCLLKASPFPADGLAPGELLLSYREIQRELSQPGRQMSKSTISRALRYLEAHGYLHLEAAPLRGIKARVLNWDKYQSTADPGPEPSPGTESVPAKPVPGTESVPGLVQKEYQAGTLRVPARGPEPSNGAAPGATKNNKNMDLDLDVDVVMRVCQQFEQEFGRPLSPIETRTITSWLAENPEDLLAEALARAVMQGKRTLAYVGGILRGWRRAGITTVEQAAQQDRRRQKRAGKTEAVSGWNQDEERRRQLLKSLYLS